MPRSTAVYAAIFIRICDADHRNFRDSGLPRSDHERVGAASTLIRAREGIVPELCVGMQAVTLRVTERGSVPG